MACLFTCLSTPRVFLLCTCAECSETYGIIHHNLLTSFPQGRFRSIPSIGRVPAPAMGTSIWPSDRNRTWTWLRTRSYLPERSTAPRAERNSQMLTIPPQSQIKGRPCNDRAVGNELSIVLRTARHVAFGTKSELDRVFTTRSDTPR